MAIQPYQGQVQQQNAQARGMPMGSGQAIQQPQPQQIQIPQDGQSDMPDQSSGQMPENMDFGSMSPAQQEQIVSKIIEVVLAQRINQMSDEELHELDEVITPESVTILAKLLPEMIPIFKHASAFQNGGNPNEMEEENQMMGESEEGEEGDDEHSSNPFTSDVYDEEDEMPRNPAISRGLVG